MHTCETIEQSLTRLIRNPKRTAILKGELHYPYLMELEDTQVIEVTGKDSTGELSLKVYEAFKRFNELNEVVVMSVVEVHDCDRFTVRLHGMQVMPPLPLIEHRETPQITPFFAAI